MSASVRYPGPASKYAVDRDPNHVRHCRALATAMWGYASTVARMTGIPERMLQHFMAPQSEKEGPFDKGARIVRALRECGAPSWCEPVRELADEFGFDLAPRCEVETVKDLERRMLHLAAQTGDLAHEVETATDDGRMTVDEAASIEREAQQLIEVAHRIIRGAHTCAGPRGVVQVAVRS